MRLKFSSLRDGTGIPDGAFEIVLWGVIGGTFGSTALRFAGGSGSLVVIGGLISAAAAAAMAHAWREAATRRKLEQLLEAARREMMDLSERQAQSEAKMAEVERRTIESPALVWRAATADIEALSGLVSNLAAAVADHDRRLAAAETAPAREAAPPAPAAPVPAQTEPGPAVSSTPPATPHPAVVAELKTTLAATLASDRLELCLQPIAALPQRSVKGYRATLRLKSGDGGHQDEADLRRLAAAAGLEAEFDRALVERAVQVLRILRARNREVTAVCGMAGGSLGSESFRLALEALGRSDPALASAVTLEMAEAEFETLDPAEREAMGALAAKGFGFGLSQLRRLGSGLAEATAAGVRRLRVDAADLLAAQHSVGSDIHPADLPEFLRRRGVELLVSGVETEQTVLDLLELAAPLAMGPLFGVARPVRPEILEPKAVAATALRDDAAPNAAEPDGAGQTPRPRRQSFRSVLRRA